MEERALYRAILAAPHDDAVRLAYADWLDEHADTLPQPSAERGRARFIRAQCASARETPAGWQTPGRGPLLTDGERRLLFHHGRKWRQAFPANVSSAPFDRGFLRPHRALTAPDFLALSPPRDFALMPTAYLPFLPLPDDSSARRYVPEEDGPVAAAPLWDVHLYAPGWLNDPLADDGQFGPLLDDVARNPGLRQVGWLKLSFFRTPLFDFLRHGRFDNVETLVLNGGPFPGVLEAVALNESFRSLRYVRFGTDLWAWAPPYGHDQHHRYITFRSKLAELNERHLPFGAMRTELLRVLQTTPLPPPVPPPPLPVFVPPAPANWSAPATGTDASGWWGVLATVIVLAAVVLSGANRRANSPPTFHYQPTPIPPPKPLELPVWMTSPRHDPMKDWKEYEKLRELLKKMEAARQNNDGVLPPDWMTRPWPPVRPTAPPPRPVQREVAPPPRAVESDSRSRLREEE